MIKAGGQMNIKIKKLIVTFLFLLLGLIPVHSPVLATTFDLIAPSGQLVRDQEVKFTINIDTEGKSFLSTAIGMTYETQYLEYISVTSGDTFTTVSADVQETGKLIITGTSTSSYSGSGVFAYITYKLIATAPGSTQLCVLFNPATPTPTLGPTSPPIVPTSPPVPTSLPKSGESEPVTKAIALASFFIIIAAGGLFIFKRI